MSDFDSVIGQLTPEIYSNMKRAVELGRWPDGRRVTPEQRETCMQAVIAWEAKNLPEQERSGYMPKNDCVDAPDEQVVTLKGIPEGDPDA